jgi:hypothetical protein
LFQHAEQVQERHPVAVLEQPSPREVEWLALGRRNIVLSQRDELNARPEDAMNVPRECS